MVLLGVDGGGTKTAFLLMNEEGQILARTTLGSLGWFQVGADGVRATLNQGIGRVCAEAGVDRSGIAYAMLGVPCIGDELIGEEAMVEELVHGVLPGVSFSVVNDTEVGWAGSLACRPGIHLVAGTGAIGFGVNAAGQTARASGWGHEVGDEGSAYWLGAKLLATFTRETDGREARSQIYDVVCRHFELQDGMYLLKVLQQQWGWNREKIASLATLVYQAAEAGEPKAVEAFAQAAQELSLIVRAIERQLEFAGTAEIPVSYSGGVFRAGNYMTEPLRQCLGGSRFVLTRPLLEPVAGAALYAFQKWRPDADLAGLVQALQRQAQQ